jgi:hypothetical protein
MPLNPVVFVLVNDAVGHGPISSLARPGGNVTGFTFFEYAIPKETSQPSRQPTSDSSARWRFVPGCARSGRWGCALS